MATRLYFYKDVRKSESSICYNSTFEIISGLQSDRLLYLVHECRRFSIFPPPPGFLLCFFLSFFNDVIYDSERK